MSGSSANLPPRATPTGRPARGRGSVVVLLFAAGLLFHGAGPARAGDLQDFEAVICLLPVRLPIEVDESDPRPGDLEARLTRYLEAAHFGVVGSKEVSRVHDRILGESDDFFDPATGDLLHEHYDRFIDLQAKALDEELGCDVTLRPSVELLRAPFANGAAHWDGRSMMVATGGLVALQVLGGVSSYGWVSALSLWLDVRDLHENPVAFRSAGIEPLIKFGVTVDQDRLPQDAWLTDGDHVDRAIDLAIGQGGDALRRDGVPESTHLGHERR